MTTWIKDAVFYHIYPLGFCGAPIINDFQSSAVDRLSKLYTWMDHIQYLGANAVYLGPLFESTSHGYDTADYYWVDRRLGTNELFAEIVREFHRRGIRVILDAVFNHTGRNFWAFRDLLQNKESSPYRDWYAGVRFDRSSPYHDPFAYEGWNGYYNLVKLNLSNPAVREHLFNAVRSWMETFGIDGLRLDAADCIDIGFLDELSRFCTGINPDFWLMGEIIHGDYKRWAHPGGIHSVTNYEAYKGLYSSLNDRNYFEMAYTLNRQYGETGLYRNLDLYNFVDNHDVDRVATKLKNPAHLYPLYALLFTMPGVPSIYYGSEFGIEGNKDTSDQALRPDLDLHKLQNVCPHPDLPAAIRRFAELRKRLPALRHGDYRQIQVGSEVLVFERQTPDETVIIALNTADQPQTVTIDTSILPCGNGIDELNAGERIGLKNGKTEFTIPPCWARVIRLEK